jgi:hypothetical protein
MPRSRVKPNADVEVVVDTELIHTSGATARSVEGRIARWPRLHRGLEPKAEPELRHDRPRRGGATP